MICKRSAWCLGGETAVFLLFFLCQPPYSQATQSSSDSWTFLPSETLFAPLIGDPREPHTSLTVEPDPTFNVPGFTHQNLYEGAVGTQVELLRYSPADGTQWGWGLFGAGFILLGQEGATFPMLAGDWIAGTYVSESYGAFSSRLEFEHQSAHLGDALENLQPPIFYSRENFNFTESFYPSSQLRLYAGLGFWENIAPVDKLGFGSLGAEIYSDPLWFLGTNLRAYGTYHLKLKQEAGGVANNSVQVGLQWKAKGDNTTAIRAALIYYNGNTEFGQFYLQHDEYWGLAVYFDP